MTLPRIFVSVASYRDSECSPTLADMFARATHPERIFAGVLWQLIPGDDDEYKKIPESIPQGHVRDLLVHANESLGACWARSQILTRLWQGEEYIFQIDSHSRFVEGWDERLLAMHAACPSSRAVLSTYPLGYTPPDQLDPPHIPYQLANRFHEQGVLLLHSRTLSYNTRPATPFPGAFVAAGCLFAPSQAFQEVPYDPYLYFQGEETTLAARLWTHGWDLFVPNDIFLYHDYQNGRNRPRHWTDNRDWSTLDRRSYARVRHLLSGETCNDTEAIREIHLYGLGTQRTLAEYQRFAGVNFAKRTISLRAADGHFPMPAIPDQQTLTRRFSGIFTSNGWGAMETRSGPGSTLYATQDLRAALPELFKQLNIRSLIDAGCGDLNWFADIIESLDLYLGYDIAPEVIEYVLQWHGWRPRCAFKTADITHEILPAANAILCRHVLPHLPNTAVCKTLNHFRRSGARYLIATTRPGAQNTDTQPGNWRPLDLCAPPFNLPSPALLLIDGDPNRLGVWDLQAAHSH